MCALGALWSSVSGGFENRATGYGAWIGGGSSNVAGIDPDPEARARGETGTSSSVAGGYNNNAFGKSSSVPGGVTVTVRNNYHTSTGVTSTGRGESTIVPFPGSIVPVPELSILFVRIVKVPPQLCFSVLFARSMASPPSYVTQSCSGTVEPSGKVPSTV